MVHKAKEITAVQINIHRDNITEKAADTCLEGKAINQ
jgi:hypothetical protein